MKKVLSIITTIAVLLSMMLFAEVKLDASSQVYNAFKDFDTVNSDGSNVPWQYMYSNDGGYSFFLMDNTSDNKGLKWYPPHGESTNTALGIHTNRLSLEVLIVDSIPDNVSLAALAFVAPADGVYKLSAEIYGHQYDGQSGDRFLIYKESKLITSISFGADRSVHLEYAMPGAIGLKKGEKIYIYQTSLGGTHHSAFVNAVVEGPISNYSGDIFVPTEDKEPTEEPGEETEYEYSHLGMSPGVNQSEINFNWFNKIDRGNPIVEVVSALDYAANGFSSANKITFEGTSKQSVPGFRDNKVTVKNLVENTEYFYRISATDSSYWSDAYSFKTKNPTDYEVLFFGDPQIGSSGDVRADTEIWIDTLRKSINKYPDASFLLSPGDQVEHGSSMLEYDGFFEPDYLRRYPVAVAIGNHEIGALNIPYHFNQPNLTGLADSNAGSDYYFSYGDTLFIVLNSNIVNAVEHREAVRLAVESHKDARWKVVMMHHNMYSAGYWYANAAFTLGVRERLFPIMDEFGIDIVLNGHDHSYARSKFMYNNTPVDQQHTSQEGAYIYPNGTVYITGNSSTGSKYYELIDNFPDYLEVVNQLNVPSFSKIAVNNNEFVIETYRTDTMEVYDTITIQKAVYTAQDLIVFIEKAKQLENPQIDEVKWQTFMDAIDSAQIVADDTSSTSEDYNLALVILLDAQMDVLADIINPDSLLEQIQIAKDLYENSVEGQEPGEYEEGARASFLQAITSAENLLTDKATRQVQVDEMVGKLREAIREFESKKIRLQRMTDESIVYDAYLDFSGEITDGLPWQYMFTMGDGTYEYLETFDFNAWRAVPGAVWAGVGKNSDVPNLLEFNTGHGDEHIGVLVFVAPEDGFYTINEINVLGNMWEQRADEFYVLHENEVLQSGRFEDVPETNLILPEYTLEMNKGENLYFFVTKIGESVSVYTNVVVEQLIVPEQEELEEEEKEKSEMTLVIVIAVTILILILGGIGAYFTVKYKGKEKKNLASREDENAKKEQASENKE